MTETNERSLEKIIYEEFSVKFLGELNDTNVNANELISNLAQKHCVNICRQVGAEEANDLLASDSIVSHLSNENNGAKKDYYLIYNAKGGLELSDAKRGIFLAYYDKPVKTIKNSVDLINDLDH